MSMRTLVKCNLRCLLSHVNVLKECTVHAVLLLLHSGAELEQSVGDRLVSSLENIDQSDGFWLVFNLDRRVSV